MNNALTAQDGDDGDQATFNRRMNIVFFGGLIGVFLIAAGLTPFLHFGHGITTLEVVAAPFMLLTMLSICATFVLRGEARSLSQVIGWFAVFGMIAAVVGGAIGSLLFHMV